VPKKPEIFEQIGEDFDDVIEALLKEGFTAPDPESTHVLATLKKLEAEQKALQEEIAKKRAKAKKGSKRNGD